MKFKLDENLGAFAASLFRQAGHDVATVFEQNLTSASDRKLIDVCCSEDRCLVTLDLDFSNPLVFRPSAYAGIAVLRLPPKTETNDLRDAVRTLLGGLIQKEIKGRLWVVQRRTIREYQPNLDE